MTIVDMLGQSGILTILGMGIVFSFLVVLVICVSAMGKIVRAAGVNKDAASGGSGQASAKTTAVTAAIIAAVSQYRSENTNT